MEIFLALTFVNGKLLIVFISNPFETNYITLIILSNVYIEIDGCLPLQYLMIVLINML